MVQEDVTEEDMCRLVAATQQMMLQFGEVATEGQVDYGSLVQNYKESCQSIVPQAEMQSIVRQFESEIEAAQNEREALMQELKSETQDRLQLQSVMLDCIQKLQSLEAKIARRKRKEAPKQPSA